MGEESRRREVELLGACESVAIGNGASGRGIAINAIRSGAENRDRLASNFFHAGENECRITSANSLPGDFAAELAISDKRDALTRVLAAEIGELIEEVVGGAVERPIVGCVVATGHETFRFRCVVSRVEKVVRGKKQ